MAGSGRPQPGPAHLARRRPSPAVAYRRRAGVVVAVVVLLVGGSYAVSRALDRGGASTVARAAGPVSRPASTAPVGQHPAAPVTTAVAPDATVTISAVGDTMMGMTPQLPPNPASYFAGVQAELRDDAQIVFGNLEGTLTDAPGQKCAGAAPGTCYAFRVPPSYAGYLAGAGFTVLNNANNHSGDFGPAGRAQTVAALHAAGIAQTGLPGQVTVVPAGPVRVAFVAFAPYRDTANLLDLPAARALITQARSQADLVVVYLHVGAEGTGAQHVTGREETYVGEDRGNAEAFAHSAIDAGASLVLASGPHVLRGMQFYQGHLIAYSLGNFAGYGNFANGGILSASAVLHVTLSATGAFRSARIAPVTLVGKGQPEPGGPAVAVIAGLSQTDFGPTAPHIGPDGTITAP